MPSDSFQQENGHGLDDDEHDSNSWTLIQSRRRRKRKPQQTWNTNYAFPVADPVSMNESQVQASIQTRETKRHASLIDNSSWAGSFEPQAPSTANSNWTETILPSTANSSWVTSIDPGPCAVNSSCSGNFANQAPSTVNSSWTRSFENQLQARIQALEAENRVLQEGKRRAEQSTGGW
jgi:hypothetical protein